MVEALTFKILDVRNDSAVVIPLVSLRLNLLLGKLPCKALSTNLSKITFHTGKEVSIQVFLSKIGYMGKYIFATALNQFKKNTYKILLKVLTNVKCQEILDQSGDHTGHGNSVQLSFSSNKLSLSRIISCGLVFCRFCLFRCSVILSFSIAFTILLWIEDS